MKKVFAIVLCLALVLSLGACAKKDDKVIKVGATPAPRGCKGSGKGRLDPGNQGVQ